MKYIKNRYEQKVNELINSFCVPYKSKANDEYLCTVFNYVVKNYFWSEPYVIWGAGEMSQIILNNLNVSPHNLKSIIDNNEKNWGKSIGGYLVSDPQYIIENSIKNVFVVVCDENITVEIINQIKSINPNIHICSLADARLEVPSGAQSIHLEIFMKLCAYVEATNVDEKNHLLEILICLYLKIRDFVYALKYIDILIAEYNSPEKYIILRHELNTLLKNLRMELKARKSKDILLLLFDNLGAHDIYHNESNMPYFNELKNSGTYCTKAYSPAIYTKDSTACTFLKKKVKEYYDLLLYASECNKHASPLVDKVKSCNYDFNIYASEYITNNLKKTIEIDFLLYKRNENMSASSPAVFWNALTEMVSSNKPLVDYLYFYEETHLPCLGGNHSTATKAFAFLPNYKPSNPFFHYDNDSPTQIQELFNMRHAEALHYLDEQAEFYLEMLSESAIKLIYADHSRNLKGAFLKTEKSKNELYHSNAYHIPLIVQGGSVKSGIVDSVVSTVDLDEIIIELLTNSKFPNNLDNVVQVGFSGYYNPILRENLIKEGLIESVDGFYLAIDDKYKLVVDSSKNLRYFAMDNEEEEIFDKEIQNIIYDRLYTYVEKWRNR